MLNTFEWLPARQSDLWDADSAMLRLMRSLRKRLEREPYNESLTVRNTLRK